MARFSILPELVKYVEFGKEHLAFPVASHDLHHHRGENGEPQLTLVIVKPVTVDECARCHFAERYHGKEHPVGLGGLGAMHQPCATFVAPPNKFVADAKEFVHVVHDAPHESHAFTDEQLEVLHKQGITVSSVYPGKKIPGGRWRFLSSTELGDMADAAHEREEALRAAALEKQTAIAAETAKAEQKAKDSQATAAQEKETKDASDIDREARIRLRQEELRKEPSTPNADDTEKPKEPSGGKPN